MVQRVPWNLTLYYMQPINGYLVSSRLCRKSIEQVHNEDIFFVCLPLGFTEKISEQFP